MDRRIEDDWEVASVQRPALGYCNPPEEPEVPWVGHRRHRHQRGPAARIASETWSENVAKFSLNIADSFDACAS